MDKTTLNNAVALLEERSKKLANTKFPENICYCMSFDDIEKFMRDPRKIPGVRKIETWINKYDDE